MGFFAAVKGDCVFCLMLHPPEWVMSCLTWVHSTDWSMKAPWLLELLLMSLHNDCRKVWQRQAIDLCELCYSSEVLEGIQEQVMILKLKVQSYNTNFVFVSISVFNISISHCFAVVRACYASCIVVIPHIPFSLPWFLDKCLEPCFASILDISPFIVPLARAK